MPHRPLTSRRGFKLGAALVAAVFSAASHAEVLVDQAWARATPGGSRMTASYLHIANTGSEDDRIVAISSPIASDVMLHMSLEENGVAKMGHLDGLSIKAHSEITLRPGDTHVMLMGLSRALATGDHFPLVLTFEHAGKIETQVEVRALVH